ncbi:2-Hydroxyacid oxidase 1-like [Eupeodes corollae]|uniref:2-Hydroxyacid oxidase 1-like n=1 Tax=Eupeodes corollae TaxID=290404 RepID=UPI00248FF22F|nr:2-Hydroxyacid oxidase 1-like [Eupeodes corollae]
MAFVCLADFQKKAETILEKSSLEYFQSGAGDELTLSLNREAFKRLRIRPRFLRNITKLNTTTTILGCEVKWPLGISPCANQRLAHPDGEIGTARATGKTGGIFILSTGSNTPMEEVAKGAPDTHKWFNLYIYKDRLLTESLVRRAEKSNYKAIVLTIDSQISGQRRADIRNKFSLPPNLSFANFSDSKASTVKSSGAGSGLSEYFSSLFDPTITWKDVEWLVKMTNLPIIVKGVLTREDAILAKEFGCKGIIVSNHGARQLDSVPATIEALPEIVDAVGNDLPVMMDGGIMDGNDMLKALALGAKMVFIGRAAVWGLACNGQKGVEEMLSILKKDFEVVMSLSGCLNLKSIQPNLVAHESTYAKL